MKHNSKLKNISGIYQIRNTVNGKIYIGRTNCFYTRCTHYISNFRFQKSDEINSYLLASMNKYGFVNFEFEIVEKCDVSKTIERESFWINEKGTLNRSIGYNLRNDGFGKIYVNEEIKNKIRNSKLSQWQNPNYRNLMSQRMKESWSPENKKQRILNLRKNDSKKSKFEYYINGSGPYRCYQIKNSKLRNSLLLMWKNKTDKVSFDGSLVERKLKNG